MYGLRIYAKAAIIGARFFPPTISLVRRYVKVPCKYITRKKVKASSTTGLPRASIDSQLAPNSIRTR